MSDLRKTLSEYDHWQIPHLGDARTLTPEQRQENHQAILQEKPKRLAVIHQSIPEIRSALDTLLDSNGDLVPAIQCIEEWWLYSLIKVNLIPPLNSLWRRIFTPGAYLAENEALAWAHWDRRDDHPFVPKLGSLLDDLGLALAEAVILRRPDFSWKLNEYDSERKTDTIEWGRTCILSPATKSRPIVAFDVPNLTRKSYGMLFANQRIGINRPAHEEDGIWYGPFFGWIILDIVDGGYTNDYYPEGPAGRLSSGCRHG